jgi:hypothetical protein
MCDLESPYLAFSNRLFKGLPMCYPRLPVGSGFLTRKKMVCCDDPPEDRVISIFAGCLANHDRAHSLMVIYITLDSTSYCTDFLEHFFSWTFLVVPLYLYPYICHLPKRYMMSDHVWALSSFVSWVIILLTWHLLPSVSVFHQKKLELILWTLNWFQVNDLKTRLFEVNTKINCSF